MALINTLAGIDWNHIIHICHFDKQNGQQNTGWKYISLIFRVVMGQEIDEPQPEQLEFVPCGQIPRIAGGKRSWALRK